MKIVLISSICSLLAGCASIISDTAVPITINSTPSQASFIITNQAGAPVHSGKTPSTVTLKTGAGYFHGEKYSVKYSKEGYSDTDAVIDSHINGWYFGNFAFGGLLGFLVIDPLTGAMWDLPDNTTSSLTKN